uniref:Zygote arrest 1 like n=1 Tax=Leptobrachium leishanense TaxID=445787 RepID=A0A8C5QKQ0_9ANUR
MAGFVYPSYNAYQGFGRQAPHGPAHQPYSKGKQGAWKSVKTLEPADYLDSFQRAQLKAILSQVNPGLTPRLRKINTKEVGVQVNPRVETGVQCSLGPRTLRRPSLAKAAEPLHFTRPVAVYSQATERRPFPLPAGGRTVKSGPGPAGGEQPPEREPGKEKPQEPGEGAGEQVKVAVRDKYNGEEKRKSAFQFLEQKYGYFHCKDCKTRWESAYVWCISGSNKVYFKQLCRKCQKGFNPYRVEEIQCQICSKTRCSCPQKKRHIDLKRPHRQELCGRCKNKRLSCDNTYSFRYIV